MSYTLDLHEAMFPLPQANGGDTVKSAGNLAAGSTPESPLYRNAREAAQPAEDPSVDFTADAIDRSANRAQDNAPAIVSDRSAVDFYDETISSRGALAELSEVYRQWGFQSGYSQATRDHLGMFVANAEAVLSGRAGAPAERAAARRLLYAFIARLQRRMGQFNPSAPVELPRESVLTEEHLEMAGGLGI